MSSGDGEITGEGPGGVGRIVSRPLRISLVGGSRASAAELELAERVGALVAEHGAVLVCGGMGGVMEAAARGAAEAGGLTVGILPGDDPERANPWIALPLATGLGHARNALVPRSGDAVVAVGGSWGTLSELGFARLAGRPVVLLGDPPAGVQGFEMAETPEEAVARALEAARRARGGRPPSALSTPEGTSG